MTGNRGEPRAIPVAVLIGALGTGWLGLAGGLLPGESFAQQQPQQHKKADPNHGKGKQGGFLKGAPARGSQQRGPTTAQPPPPRAQQAPRRVAPQPKVVAPAAPRVAPRVAPASGPRTSPAAVPKVVAPNTGPRIKQKAGRATPPAKLVAPGAPKGPTTGAPPAPTRTFVAPPGGHKGPTQAAPAPGFLPKGGSRGALKGGPTGPTTAGPVRLDDVKKGRVVRVDKRGARVIEEPGNRIIIKRDNRIVIRRDEGKAFLRFAPGARTRVVGNGVRETVVLRPGGVRVITEVDGNGRLLRRYRRDPSGREIVFIDNRRFYRNAAIGVGVAALGVGTALVLARPAVALPRAKYIVDYDRASDEDIYEALIAPPVARLERSYSLEEIRYSEPLREYMRRIDLDTVNFEFGSFEVTPDQYPKLERLARIMRRVIDRNPGEVFMIEGHTDKVGSEEDNLTLSDRRAEAVVDILVNQFGIPPENLVTQGYGEQFPKVPTAGPERANRRVAVRRITPLLGEAQR